MRAEPSDTSSLSLPLCVCVCVWVCVCVFRSPVTKGAVFAVLGLVMLVGGQAFVVLCVSILRLCSGKKKGKRKTG